MLIGFCVEAYRVDGSCELNCSAFVQANLLGLFIASAAPSAACAPAIILIITIMIAIIAAIIHVGTSLSSLFLFLLVTRLTRVLSS